MTTKILFIGFCAFIFLFSNKSFGQKDTLQYNKNNAFESYKSKYLGNAESSLQLELMTAKNEANEQRIYKNVLIAASGFILLLSLFIVYLFFSKNKQISELIGVQNREIKLREMQVLQLSSILNNIDNVVLILSENGKIRWLNKTFEKFYGQTLERLQENSTDNFITDLLNEQEKKYVNKCINDKTNFSYIVESGNDDFKLKRNFIIIKDNENKVSGIAVTENKIF